MINYYDVYDKIYLYFLTRPSKKLEESKGILAHTKDKILKAEMTSG